MAQKSLAALWSDWAETNPPAIPTDATDSFRAAAMEAHRTPHLMVRDGATEKRHVLRSWMDLDTAMAVIGACAERQQRATWVDHRGWQSAKITPQAVLAAVTFATRPEFAGHLDPEQFPCSVTARRSRLIPAAIKYVTSFFARKEAA